MPSEKKRCPHCDAEIDHLCFQNDIVSYGTEGGTCDLEGDYFDYNGETEYHDSESTDTRYKCPDCGAEVDPEDLLEIDGEEEAEDEEVEYNEDGVPMHKIEEPKPKIIPIDTRNYSTVHALVCSECGNDLNPYDKENEAKDGILCTKCGTLLTKDTAKVISFGK